MPRQRQPKRFGEKLHRLRLRNDLTLKGLAHALGYSTHGYLSELETGKKVPTVEFVLKVADLFDVSTDELIKDELELAEPKRGRVSEGRR